MPWFHLVHQAHDANYNHLQAWNGGGGLLYRNAGAPLEWESFVLWAPNPPRGGNDVALQAWNGQFVCAENGGGAHLVADRGWIREWETFIIRFADNPGSTLPIVNGNVISLQAWNGRTSGGNYVTGPTANGHMQATAGGVGATERFRIWSQSNQPRPAYWGWRDLPAIV